MNVNCFQFKSMLGCTQLHKRKNGLVAVFSNPKKLVYIDLNEKQDMQDLSVIVCDKYVIKTIQVSNNIYTLKKAHKVRK